MEAGSYRRFKQSSAMEGVLAAVGAMSRSMVRKRSLYGPELSACKITKHMLGDLDCGT